jgi:hypothetical protein
VYTMRYWFPDELEAAITSFGFHCWLFALDLGIGRSSYVHGNENRCQDRRQIPRNPLSLLRPIVYQKHLIKVWLAPIIPPFNSAAALCLINARRNEKGLAWRFCHICRGKYVVKVCHGRLSTCSRGAHP